MPIESQHNHLIIIEDEKGRRNFTLDQATYSIGRDPKCDLQLISQFVSRHHATLVKKNIEGSEDFRYQIVDGNAKGKASVNGLLVNGRKVQNHDLKNEDIIVFGPRVRAIYYLLQRDTIATVPPDEFDITLISPNMIDDFEDEDEPTFPEVENGIGGISQDTNPGDEGDEIDGSVSQETSPGVDV
jgi:pSer/pThr/pTyr-binding forkhead associated (FHA) protein